MKKLLWIALLLFWACLALAYVQAASPVTLGMTGSTTPVHTYFGTATNCTDSCSQGASPVTITPPADMVQYDLVVVYTISRSNATMAVSEAGGQTWNSETRLTNNGVYQQVHWAIFDGTWDASPQFTASDVTNGFTVVMAVFRPGTTPYTWAVDVNEANEAFGAPSSPYDVTATQITTNTNNAVVLYLFGASNDCTWTIQTAGWTNVGTNQYRNIYGSDGSSSIVYKIQATAGATGAVVNRQGDYFVTGDVYTIAFK